jgi:hypothetical protein
MFIDWINEKIKKVTAELENIKTIETNIKNCKIYSSSTKETIKNKLFNYEYDGKEDLLNFLLNYKAQIDDKKFIHEKPVKVVIINKRDNLNISFMMNLEKFMNTNTIFFFENYERIFLSDQFIQKNEIDCIEFAIEYYFEGKVLACEWTGEDIKKIDIENLQPITVVNLK